MQMGLGLLGDPNIVFKRKFRWTFDVENICGGQSLGYNFVKLAARPNLDIEEIEINFLHGVDWVPGKGKWNTISVTYYDVVSTGVNASTGSNIGVLYTWLRSVYEFADPINLPMGSTRSSYAATVYLNLYDGCGNILETWTLNNVWPQAIDFGELDYSMSDIAEINLTLRYSNVQYTPSSSCGNVPNPCCYGCGT